MGAPLPWLALAAAVTLINGLTLRYLARREPSRASLLWSWAWLAWAASVIPMMLLGPEAQAHPLFVVVGLLWGASALGFLRGSYALLERPLPRAWYGIAAGAAVVSLLLAAGTLGTLAMMPLALFQCAGMIAAGAMMLRNAPGQTGAWLYGVALVLLGIHVLDAPVVMRSPGLLPWGFVVALSLEIVAALGMVVLHYEQAYARALSAERALEGTRRLEALGRVAGSVAHDFNNLLTILQGHLELLRAERSRSEASTEALAGIDYAITQGSRLTRQLLAFGRRAETQPGSVDVREVTQATLDMLAKLVPKSIALELHCAEGDYHAVLDRTLLEQVVLNLVTNARDAIDGSGTIRVDLEQRSSPEPGVLLRVSDDGAGMDAELLGRIFEPFFTTKGSERGTGLGLATVQGAVSQLGGQIQVASELGRGTKFDVLLPRAPRGSILPAR